ncbi:Transposase [Lactobacillus helveticus CIRM-BIA 953]|uniref:Transposase n=1 Tax=Lactobacillus helveticus CIRM-BIA 953 TaxID=1226335 RepID=U4QGC2_LACHE|nr:Transposase [Lactobacillus helveticus CIRM-BIA 953]
MNNQDFDLGTVKHFLNTIIRLPINLCFDEFRSTHGSMSFICIDADTHKSVKVLSDRLNRTIKQFFLSQYSTAERAAVQRVIMDMNASYQAFVHELFPNAELIMIGSTLFN